LLDPSALNMERLQDMKLKDVVNMYQNSNIRDKQMLESELIKARSKNDKEIFTVLKTISEYNRFNSPVVKLGDYLNKNSSFRSSDSYITSTHSGIELHKQHSLNTFLNRILTRTPSSRMSVIIEDKDVFESEIVDTQYEELKVLKSSNESDKSAPVDTTNKTSATKLYFGPKALDDLFHQISPDDNFVSLKEQGTLIKWIEGKKLGTAQYGDVV
jgi:hypothetical protein